MNEPERLAHALIFFLQIGNHTQHDHLVQNEQDKPAYGEEIIFRSAIDRGNGIIQKEKVDVNRDKRHQKNPNNQLRALVLAARDLFFKLRVNNGRRSFQMNRVALT